MLDLGCGPGRHLAALRALGKRGLGVDLSPVAVALARDRGADAINGSLWANVPGTWRTILLLDGNIGIGGNPVALLRRAGELLAAARRDPRRDRPAGRADATASESGSRHRTRSRSGSAGRAWASTVWTRSRRSAGFAVDADPRGRRPHVRNAAPT